MRENVLKWLPRLTPEDRKEIVFAVNTFSARYRTDPRSYDATATDVGFLERKEVIDALREVYRVYGTAAALAIAETLESDP
jgi:hypothetical protein